MNKLLFLSISLSCLPAVASMFCTMPVLAQGGQNVPATGYCTGETVQVSGWEHDLVRRNKGLEKFHWSAINTVQHYNVVPAGSARKEATRGPSPYQMAKPRISSNWSSPKGAPVEKSDMATANSGGRGAVNAHFLGASPSSYWQIGRGYETKHFIYKQVPDDGSSDRRVSARVMHY